MAKNMESQLRSSKAYLKTDYKVHVSSDSPCGDHCRRFTLSSSESQFRVECSHKHTMSCDRCEELKNVILELELFVNLKISQHRLVLFSMIN